MRTILKKVIGFFDRVDAICKRYSHILAVAAFGIAALGGWLAYQQLQSSAAASKYGAQIDAMQLLVPDIEVVSKKAQLYDGDLHLFVRYRNNGEFPVSVTEDFLVSFQDCLGTWKSEKLFVGNKDNPYQKDYQFVSGDAPVFRFRVPDLEWMFRGAEEIPDGHELNLLMTIAPVSFTPLQEFFPQLTGSVSHFPVRTAAVDGKKVTLPTLSYSEAVSEVVSIRFGPNNEIQNVQSAGDCF